MQITVPVNHNFYENDGLTFKEVKRQSRSGKWQIDRVFSDLVEIKLGNNRLDKVKVFAFKDQPSRFGDDQERLVLRTYTKEVNEERKYFVQTGLYAGVLFNRGCKFNITSKYGDAFLRRMLNCVNDIYIDNEKSTARKEEGKNEFLYIIAYLFIQALEKATVLGLPRNYQTHTQRSHKVRGKTNINEYLRRDIPFQGKLTTTYREQTYIQEIVDVLYLSLKHLEKEFGRDIHSKVHQTYNLLLQHYSGNYVNYERLQKAKKHQILNNPMYAPFKKVLDYAEIILMNKDLIADHKEAELETSGFLFDIAELFEVYLEKILSTHLVEWDVLSQRELTIYDSTFYKRPLYPDLVLKHKYSNKLVVFDAKFKNMELEGRDVDRNDIHQIHSYIQYHQPDVIMGGLLYPLSVPMNSDKAHAKSLFDNPSLADTGFIVDGIYVNEDMNMSEIMENENRFVDRIVAILNDQVGQNNFLRAV